MAIIPLATADRLIRKAGAKRVSDEAAKALVEALEEEALRIASEAVKLAAHAKRRTVREEDIRLASKRV
ncbi:MAG: NFYB/HAP3 family transcription factor subunit [Candidatus Hadarchaeales archaeon]